MKVIGAILLILITSWIGFDLSRQLQNRTKELREILHSLQILEAEMEFTNAPLRIVFLAVEKKTKSPINKFYQSLADELNFTVSDFPTVWEEALEVLLKGSALKKEEVEVLNQFGKNIGNHTFEQQEKHIHLTIHHLKHILSEANEEKHKYQRMAKTLGVLTGVFIVLLLF